MKICKARDDTRTHCVCVTKRWQHKKTVFPYLSMFWSYISKAVLNSPAVALCDDISLSVRIVQQYWLLCMYQLFIWWFHSLLFSFSFFVPLCCVQPIFEEAAAFIWLQEIRCRPSQVDRFQNPVITPVFSTAEGWHEMTYHYHSVSCVTLSLWSSRHKNRLLGYWGSLLHIIYIKKMWPSKWGILYLSH